MTIVRALALMLLCSAAVAAEEWTEPKYGTVQVTIAPPAQNVLADTPFSAEGFSETLMMALTDADMHQPNAAALRVTIDEAGFRSGASVFFAGPLGADFITATFVARDGQTVQVTAKTRKGDAARTTPQHRMYFLYDSLARQLVQKLRRTS